MKKPGFSGSALDSIRTAETRFLQTLREVSFCLPQMTGTQVPFAQIDQGRFFF
jgi:hypothetical protein